MTNPLLQTNQALAKAIDELLAQSYKAGEPGAAVIVVRDGKTILRKGYGMANVELGVAIKPEMVFRLGSLTKQFTAVAILMLVEEGRLALDDEISQFLPDFPTQDPPITVEHLLTHTAGIKNYTDLPAWLSLWRQDMTLTQLIDLFKDQPLVFAPGEAWSYSNSGYILLGAIIEQVSGLSYAEFIQQRIFEPLGMKRALYDQTDRLVAGRVAGYTTGANGVENAPYLSMSQPYAAGSLAASVDDLARWDAALYTDKLLKTATLQQAFTPYQLSSGESTGYGYGWLIGTYADQPVIEHDGGIHGFSTHAIRLPKAKVFVAILANSDTPAISPGDLAFKIAALTIGKPYVEPTAITLPAAVLDAYVGVYQVNQQAQIVVSKEANRLFAQASGSPKMEMLPASATEFFIKNTFLRLRFEQNAAGEVTTLTVQDRSGPPSVAQKTDKPLPQPRQAAEVDPALYADYVGEYQLAPAISITISSEDDKLFAQVTGQQKFEIFPEAETKFFYTVVDAQIEFVRKQGEPVTGLVLYQNGQEIPGEKIK